MDYLGGGGGAKVCWPPSQIIGGGGGAPPSSYAYDSATIQPILGTSSTLLQESLHVFSQAFTCSLYQASITHEAFSDIRKNGVVKQHVDSYLGSSSVSAYFEGWLVGWLFGLNGPLRQYLSLYRAVSQREGERREK